MNNLVTPNCCEQAQKYAVVVLQYVHDFNQWDYFENGNYLKDKPKWVAKALNEEDLLNQNSDRMYFEVTHCPFCGKNLPDIKIRETKLNIRKINDGGYYCANCHERLNTCRCMPIEYMWQPV